MQSRTVRTPGWLGSHWCAASLNCDERERIKKALLDYCGQDTLALVKLLERLRSVSTKPDAEVVRGNV